MSKVVGDKLTPPNHEIKAGRRGANVSGLWLGYPEQNAPQIACFRADVLLALKRAKWPLAHASIPYGLWRISPCLQRGDVQLIVGDCVYVCHVWRWPVLRWLIASYVSACRHLLEHAARIEAWWRAQEFVVLLGIMAAGHVTEQAEQMGLWERKVAA